MNFPKPLRALTLLYLTAGLLGLCLPSQFAYGDLLQLSLNQNAVRVIAISPTIFQISVNAGGAEAKQQNSIFLDPAFKPGDVGKRGDVAGHSQLTTSAGSIDVDPVAGTISLLDAHGTVLAPPASVASTRVVKEKPILDLHIGWPQDRPFAIYGCGNGADTLLQNKVDTRVANRIAVEPFFWAPAGFASFVVGSDDNSPAKCDGVVASNAVTWAVPGSAADLYLIIAPTLGHAANELLNLTGHPPVPPRWTLGYLQSRWGWADKAYIDDTLHQFLTRKLPVDAFIFDFEWYASQPDYKLKTDGLKDFADFGWNAKLFPDPQQQIQQLHDAGVHFVGIRKPRLGNSDTLAMIRQKGWGLQSGGKVDARGMSFATPEARAWYAQQTQPLLGTGVDGWWNDEGEFSYTTYMYWNMAQQQALDAVHPQARFWTINRAFQPGLSRTGAAAWTGDIRASWNDLKRTPTALLNWSVAGMPLGACDIGGFAGQATPELLTRWMQAGTFFPIMRCHSSIGAKPHFPWLFGDQAEAAIRKTLELRYRLLPVLYSLAHQMHTTGQPIMRPLIMQYPADPKVADLSSEWLVGQDLLAAPQLTQDPSRTVYLPDDIWYDFATSQRVDGNREITVPVPFDVVPVYIRGGTILTLAPLIQHTRDLPGGPLDVQVYPGRNGQFTLVEDDGSTTAYLTGNIRSTIFTWNETARTLSWQRTGPYDGPDCFREMNVIVHDGVTRQPINQALSAATGSVAVGR